MQTTRLWIVLGAAFVAGAFCPAAEQHLEFLRGLQERGYADVALEYLDLLDARKDLSPRIRETLDLERSNSYLAWARSTADAKLAEQRMAQAQSYLNKFAKEYPRHPRAAGATAFKAELALHRGQALLAGARRIPDAGRRAALLAGARPGLTEACKSLEDTLPVFRKWLAEMPAPAPGAAGNAARIERSELELAAMEIRFKAGLANYYLAQTYADPADPQRKQILEHAAKLFDDIYQDYRDSSHNGCLLAHLWQGRVLEELGQATTAYDIYEEVLAGANEDVRADSELAPIYAQAALCQLRVLAAAGKTAQCLDAAAQWLQAHKAWSGLAAYQGVMLEWAKAQLTLAKAATGDMRDRITSVATGVLRKVAESEGEYKDEAVQLLQRLSAGSGPENAGVDQYFVLGDAALNARQYPEAETNYRQALKLATAAKQQKLIAEAGRRVNRARLAQAAALFSAGKLEEAITAAGAVAREDLSDPSTGRAAVLALSAAAARYTAADTAHRPEEMERLKGIVDFVSKRWAGQPEADDARITLGQALLAGGDMSAAMAILGQVDAKSRRYPTVLFTLAQVQWRTYLEERRKDEAARSVEQMNQARAAAEKYLTQAADLLRHGPPGDSVAAAAQLAETQLLLAEIFLESAQYRQAVELLGPLVERVNMLKPETIDTVTFRTFMGAVRAYLGLGDTQRAADAALALLAIAQDQPEYNQSLVTFARIMARELQRAQAAKTAAVSGDTKTFAAATERYKALEQLLGKMLDALLKRQAFSLADMIHLGDLCAALGNNDQALTQYQRILDRVQKEPDSAEKAGRAIVRVRSQLVGLLRTQGKFEEAARQCDELIAKNPRALEPRMVKGYVLEDWAKQTPDKYDAAVAQWTEVRLLLSRLQPKPPEYYEVVYRVASCLYAQGQTTKQPARLQQAEQVLKSTLVLSPKLSGPDQVAQYRDLLKRIVAAREAAGK
jgi:tetratricopeptide (TPR) repeat protein